MELTAEQKIHIENNRSGLTEAKILEIYALAKADKITATDIAKKYGVTKCVVTNIKHGKTWSWITQNVQISIPCQTGTPAETRVNKSSATEA